VCVNLAVNIQQVKMVVNVFFGYINISMFLYAIKDQSTGYIKLGYSANPEQRLRELQTGNSGALQLVHRARINEHRARTVEQQLHRELKHLQVRGEWFDLTETRACGMIDYAIIRYEDDPLV
jgi:hypothetical protein